MKKVFFILLAIGLLFGCASIDRYDPENPHLTIQVGETIKQKYLKPFELNKPYE